MAASRTVNVRFLGVLVGALVILGPSVYFVNAYQVRRNADALKHRADQAFQDGHYEEAAVYYYRYLIQRPDDIEARIGRGRALDKKSSKTLDDLRQAFENFQYALRLGAEDNEIRRRQVDLALATGQQDVAMENIQKLLEGSHKNDGELEQLLASCYAGKGDASNAEQNYRKAIEHAPHHLRSYTQLVQLLDRLPKVQEGDKVMKQLVENNQQSALAQLLFAEREKRLHRPHESYVQKALDVEPDNPTTILAAAKLELSKHNLEEARKLLQRGIKIDNRNAEMYHALARVEMEARKLDKAEQCLRAGLKEVPEQRQIDLLYLLAVVLLQRGEVAKTQDEIENLRKRQAPDYYVNDLRARVHMHKGEWAAATSILRDLELLVAQNTDLAFQIQLQLGICYEQQRQYDNALKGYSKAVQLHPESIPACRGKAGSLMALGQTDAALNEYKAIVRKDPTVAVPIAQLELVRTLRVPPDKRDWKPVELALGNALRVAPDALELKALKAEILKAQGKTQEAEAELIGAKDKDPSQPGSWFALITFEEQSGKSEKVLALIEAAEKKLGDRVELRLFRARQLLKPGSQSPPAAALSKLEQDVEKYTPADRARLLGGLAQSYLQSGNVGDAKRLWKELAALQPKDMQPRLNLFDLAFLAGNEEELDQLLREIRGIEGEDGTVWRYCQVSRIISAAQRGKAGKEKLNEARTLLRDLESKRSNWGPAILRDAELTDLEGDTKGALDLYQRALSLGERDPNAFRRAISILYQLRRYSDAADMIAKLEEKNTVLPDDLRRLKIAILGNTSNPSAAIAEAEKPIKAGSKDPRDHLFYAQALARADKKKEADDAYRAACEYADKLPEIWVQYVLFLSQANQKAKAESLIQEAERKLPKEIAPLILAQCYEVVGKPEKVEEQYLGILKANPTHLFALRSLVNFYERFGRLSKAEPYLRRLLEPQTKASQEDVEMARRALAVILASAGDFARYQEGLDLLAENSKRGTESIADQRARALIYSKRSYYWRQAVELLEKLHAQRALGIEEELALAGLYEKFGSWSKAGRIYTDVLERQPENANILYACARSLLQHNDTRNVLVSLERLRKLESPQSTRVLEIQVRLLKAEGRLEEAAKELKNYAERPDANLETAASLLEEFGKARAAEDLYRRLVTESGRPESSLVLAAFLGRQGREGDIQEALDRCDKAWKTCPPELVAYVGISVLSGLKAPTEAQCEKVGRGLAEAIQKTPKSLSLVFYMAALRSMQQKYDDAEKLYSQIVKADERNGIARNNLAWLIAFHGGQARAQEALGLVNRAIELIGPSAELLDTRAAIHLKMDNAEEALKDLNKAIEEESLKENQSGVMYFHLAEAEEMLKVGNPTKNLKHAQNLKLKIHPLEQADFDRLLKKLGLAATGAGQSAAGSGQF